jgi:exonuclease III
VRLISWNVNKAAAERVRRQAAALAERRPDLVALQEVRGSTLAVWREELRGVGLGHVACSLEGVAEALGDRRRSTGGVLLASRWPIDGVAAAVVPWPERVLAAAVDAPGGAVEVHVAYVPNVATGPLVGNRWLKAETFEGLYRRLAGVAALPRVLCGDFNVPLREEPDGTIVPFGRPGRAAEAELSILRGLADYDLADAFRAVRGYGAREFSWYSTFGNGFRLDHVFASQSLNVRGCRYLAALRVRGLSDHAAVEADFVPGDYA